MESTIAPTEKNLNLNWNLLVPTEKNRIRIQNNLAPTEKNRIWNWNRLAQTEKNQNRNCLEPTGNNQNCLGIGSFNI